MITSSPSKRLPLLGGVLVLLLASAFAANSARLAAAGEVPSSLRGALPVAPESWYGAQALWSGPVLVGLWLLMGSVAWLLSGPRGQRLPLGRLLGAVGVGWAGPMLALLVLPELVIYELAGMDGLRTALPTLASLTLLGCWLGTTLALSRTAELSRLRSLGLATLVLVLGALAGGPFLR